MAGKSEAVALYQSQIEVDWSKCNDAENLRQSIHLGVCTRYHHTFYVASTI